MFLYWGSGCSGGCFLIEIFQWRCAKTQVYTSFLEAVFHSKSTFTPFLCEPLGCQRVRACLLLEYSTGQTEKQAVKNPNVVGTVIQGIDWATVEPTIGSRHAYQMASEWILPSQQMALSQEGEGLW
jgi:hypothetical protein